MNSKKTFEMKNMKSIKANNNGIIDVLLFIVLFGLSFGHKQAPIRIHDQCHPETSGQYFKSRILNTNIDQCRIIRDPNSSNSFLSTSSDDCSSMTFLSQETYFSVLASFGNGRLGNQMCNFASQYALSEEYGLSSYFSPYSYKTLVETFDLPKSNQRHSIFQIWNTTCADPWNFDWKHIRNLLLFSRKREYIFNALQYSNYIRLESYVCDMKGFLPHLKSLRRNVFRFYPKDMKQAKQIESKIRSSKPNSIFVTIHVRLKDSAKHLTMFNVTVASPIYFKNAMQYMTDKFGGNVVFAVFSDDIKTARTYFFKDDQSKLNIMFPNLGESSRAPSITMALLSLADHSILTYSSYGLWGALLRKTSGEILMPQEMNKTDHGYYAYIAKIPGLKFL